MKRSPTSLERSLAFISTLRQLALVLILGGPAITISLQAATISGQVVPAQFKLGPGGANVGIFVGGTRGDVIGQSYQTTTDAEGRFQIELPAGDWAIRIDHKEALKRDLLGPIIFQELTANQQITDFTIELFQPTELLTGTVLSDQGMPLPNIPISGELSDGTSAYSANTITDAAGAFSIGVFPGEWYFFAYSLPDGFQRPEAQTIIVPDQSDLAFIASTDAPRLVIDQDTLPAGTAGEEYRTRLTASGGSQPFRWRVAPGSRLPDQLELTEYTGELRGILTESGQLEFTVEVSQIIGSRSGQKTLTLPAANDVTPPRMTSTTPSGSFGIRDNSVVAIHFSEPMTRQSFMDPETLRNSLTWVHGPVFQEEDRDPTQLTFHWNASADTLYLTNPEPFELGRHVWTLNPNEIDPNQPNNLQFVRDASGNPLAVDTQIRLSFGNRANTVDPDGNPIVYHDVEEVILIKQQSFEIQDNDPEFDNASLNLTIGLPPSTWNTVKNATLTAPDQTTLDIPYFGVEDAGTSLHLFDLFFRLDDLNEDFPAGDYGVSLNTAHDGILATTLRFPSPAFPTPVDVLRDCALGHIVADQEFTLSLINTTTASAERDPTSLIQVVISENVGHKLLSLSPSPGGVYETFLPATASGFFLGSQFVEQLTIPADTLKPDTDYNGYVRSLNIVDDQALTESTRAIAAFGTLTDFRLSTKEPRVSCLSSGTSLPLWTTPNRGNDPPMIIAAGTLLPSLFTVQNDGDSPDSIELESAGTVEIQPNTTSTFDATGTGGKGLTITLHGGDLRFNTPPDPLSSGLTIETVAAQIIPTEGSYTVTHNPTNNQSTVTVQSGEVRVASREANAEQITLTAGLTLEFSPPVPQGDPVAPELIISHLASGTIQLHWKNDENTWIVQSTPSLRPTNWTTMDADIIVINDTSLVELPASGQTEFYRLQNRPIAID